MSLPSFSPRRELGRTGFIATRLGAGDVADRAVPLETCVATLRRARDAGLIDPDVALLGMSVPNEQDTALAAARFQPLTSAELSSVRTRAAVAVRDKGDCWWNPPAG